MAYRVIIQAEGVGADGEWFGAYATRQVSAESEDDAAHRVVTDFQDAWQMPGRLEAVESVAVWRAPMLSLRPAPSAGHTIYNDDAAAQAEALRLEAEAGGLPKRLLARLLSDLA